MGVPAEDLEAVFAAGELPSLLEDDDVQLGGDRREIGGGEGEEGVEGCGVGVEEGVVGVLVRLAPGGVENGVRLVEAGEGAVPNSDRAGLVIPDLIRDPSFLQR